MKNFLLVSCLKVSIAAKRYSDYSNSYKAKTFKWVAYSFRALVHYHHGAAWWFTGIVLEK